MPRKPGRKVPKYRKHKPSNRALVEIKGKRIYLGKYGTKESRDEYDRIVSEFLNPDKPPSAPPTRAGGLLIKDVILRFVQEHVLTHYFKHGRPTQRRTTIKGVMKN